jgi:23S rRNA (adenine2503-C2)-methyltransferase
MKYKIFESKDGVKKIEFEGYSVVIIPTKDEKYAVCVSCQIGCPVCCKFCHTGKKGFKRNLAAEEIIEQADIAKIVMGKNPRSVVFMGSGEPTLNLKNVITAADYFHKTLGVARDRITISTSCLKNIGSLLSIDYNVALSLHSPFDKIRKELVPSTISLRKIVSFANKFCELHRKKYVMVEYSLIKGLNDSEMDLKKLLSFKWPARTIFNLIEFNDICGFKGADSERFAKFKEEIVKKRYKSFIRQSRGSDIQAACGMLSYS